MIQDQINMKEEELTELYNQKTKIFFEIEKNYTQKLETQLREIENKIINKKREIFKLKEDNIDSLN